MSSIEKSAARLRWIIGLVWLGLILLYLAGRFHIGLGPVRIESRGSDSAPNLLLVADMSMVMLTAALFQLGRMLGAIASGELFSERVVANFRAFAAWLMVLALTWIVGPMLVAIIDGPGIDRSFQFRIQLRDVLTLGIAVILFLVARLLERARTIEAENREIV